MSTIKKISLASVFAMLSFCLALSGCSSAQLIKKRRSQLVAKQQPTAEGINYIYQKKGVDDEKCD